MNRGRILRICQIGLMAILIVSPMVAGAQGQGFDLRDLMPSFTPPIGGEANLMDVIATVISIAFALAGIVAVIYLIIGGFNYVTAGGNPEQIEMAKTTIVNAIIGLVVILVSYLIVQFIMTQLNATPELPEGE